MTGIATNTSVSTSLYAAPAGVSALYSVKRSPPSLVDEERVEPRGRARGAKAGVDASPAAPPNPRAGTASRTLVVRERRSLRRRERAQHHRRAVPAEAHTRAATETADGAPCTAAARQTNSPRRSMLLVEPRLRIVREPARRANRDSAAIASCARHALAPPEQKLAARNVHLAWAAPSRDESPDPPCASPPSRSSAASAN